MRAFAVRSFGEPASVQSLPVPADDLDAAGPVLEQLRQGGLRGKAVIRLEHPLARQFSHASDTPGDRPAETLGSWLT